MSPPPRTLSIGDRMYWSVELLKQQIEDLPDSPWPVLVLVHDIVANVDGTKTVSLNRVDAGWPSRMPAPLTALQTPTVVTPNDVTELRDLAASHLSYLLAAQRMGETLSPEEIAIIERTIDRLHAAPPFDIAQHH